MHQGGGVLRLPGRLAGCAWADVWARLYFVAARAVYPGVFQDVLAYAFALPQERCDFLGDASVAVRRYRLI